MQTTDSGGSNDYDQAKTWWDLTKLFVHRDGRATCLTCGIGSDNSTGFTSAQEQRAHFKTDWHKYNLKQKLARKLPVDLEEFERLVEKEEVWPHWAWIQTKVGFLPDLQEPVTDACAVEAVTWCMVYKDVEKAVSLCLPLGVKHFWF